MKFKTYLRLVDLDIKQGSYRFRNTKLKTYLRLVDLDIKYGSYRF